MPIIKRGWYHQPLSPTASKAEKEAQILLGEIKDWA